MIIPSLLVVSEGRALRSLDTSIFRLPTLLESWAIVSYRKNMRQRIHLNIIIIVLLLLLLCYFCCCCCFVATHLVFLDFCFVIAFIDPHLLGKVGHQALHLTTQWISIATTTTPSSWSFALLGILCHYLSQHLAETFLQGLLNLMKQEGQAETHICYLTLDILLPIITEELQYNDLEPHYNELSVNRI